MKKLLTTTVAALALTASLTANAALEPGKTTVLITGANRGIGLEYVRQIAARGWNVIATARKPAEAAELQKVAAENSRVVVQALDVTDHAAVEALGREVQGAGNRHPAAQRRADAHLSVGVQTTRRRGHRHRAAELRGQ